MTDETKRKNPISSPIGLQLGNIVYNQHGEMVTIRPNDFNRWMQPRMNGDYGIYAIPLSPEVLKSIGFEFLNGDVQKWMHFDSLIRLVPSDDKPGEYFLGGFSGSKDICYIKHLHHLQNIVFDLSGIELTYNPNQP